MSAKADSKENYSESKAYSKGEQGEKRISDSKGSARIDDDEEIIASDYKADGLQYGEDIDEDIPIVNVTDIQLSPSGPCPISSPLELSMKFVLDRDAVAAYWVIQFLVDACYSRLVRVLGETPVEDYPDGESEMRFNLDCIDFEGIVPSALTNSGLLMALLMVNGKEVATVNMVVQVYEKDGIVYRDILSPLG